MVVVGLIVEPVVSGGTRNSSMRTIMTNGMGMVVVVVVVNIGSGIGSAIGIGRWWYRDTSGSSLTLWS